MSLSVTLRQDWPGIRIAIGFEAPSHGITALFGRSGSGKTTVLNAVAGLLRPNSCRIALDGVVLADSAHGIFVRPEHRRIGVVFQDSRLFPHLNVAGNLRYGLRRAPAGTIGFDDVVELLGLATLLKRRPHTLSGGERQRVAIGRALLAQPRLLLMDEPLASLDQERRAEILPYLTRLNHSLRLPTLYVTHALEELGRLADHVVLLREGHVVAEGGIDALAARADLPLALREDAAAVVIAEVIGPAPGRFLTRARAGGAELLIRPVSTPPGGLVRLRIPAREVILARPEAAGLAALTSVQNLLAGTVRALVEDVGRQAVLAEIDLGAGAVLLARLTRDAVARLGLASGSAVLAMVKSVAIEPLDEG